VSFCSEVERQEPPATSLLTELLVLYFPLEVVLLQELLQTLALVWQWLPWQLAVLGLVSVELLAYSGFSSSAL